LQRHPPAFYFVLFLKCIYILSAPDKTIREWTNHREREKKKEVVTNKARRRNRQPHATLCANTGTQIITKSAIPKDTVAEPTCVLEKEKKKEGPHDKSVRRDLMLHAQMPAVVTQCHAFRNAE
jgi:hypothetical protein